MTIIETAARQLPPHVDLGDEREVEAFLRANGLQMDGWKWLPVGLGRGLLDAIIDRAREIRAEASELEIT